MTPDDIHRLDDRLRENERVTAALGAVQRVLVDSAKTYAPKEVVDKLDSLTRNEVVPKLAALTDRMDNQPKTPLEQLLAFLERMTGRPGFKFTLVVALLFGLGVFLWLVRAEVMQLAAESLSVQQQTETNTARSAETLSQIADSAATSRRAVPDTLALAPDP